MHLFWHCDESPTLEESLPIDHRQAIDACCDRYEQAWLAGKAPRITDFFHDVPDTVQQFLLRELIGVELEYVRDELGNQLSLEEVVARHPEFSGELAQPFAKMSTPQIARGELSAADVSQAARATVHLTGSGGLQIRCPQCQISLELLADAPLVEINCSGCGSNLARNRPI